MDKLIVLDGVDGVGKETQINLLKNQFSNLIVFKYPTKNTPELNDYLNKRIEMSGEELFRLFLKDIKEEQEKIKQALDSGKTAILDRYIFSTIAYEKDGISYEEGKKIVKEMNFLKPDKVILLDIPPSVSQERKRKQKELDRYESDLKYLEKVRNNFLKLYEEKFLCENWFLIDGNRAIEEVYKDILKIL